jgi:branched-chain amino acid transport system ATP-binding protein
MRDYLSWMKDILVFTKEQRREIDSSSLLQLKNISVAFGKLTAVNGVSFTIRQGDITSIIGPNGAGKTTILKLICGLLPLSQGEIWFKQQRLDKIPPHQIASLGVTQVFQDIQLFSNMSILENVMVGCHVWTDSGFLNTGLKLPHAKAEENKIKEQAISKLSLVGLEQKAFMLPSHLSWSEQKLSGLARALAAEPDLLLLDEPYGGLMTTEIAMLSRLILQLQQDGITILMVEQRTDEALEIANQVVILDSGEKVADASPSEMWSNAYIATNYLGGRVKGMSEAHHAASK